MFRPMLVMQPNTEEAVSLRIVLSDYGVASASDIFTDIVDSQKLVVSRIDSSHSFLELSFPCKVIDSTCKAKYKAKTGILTVSAQPAPAAAAAASQEGSSGAAPAASGHRQPNGERSGSGQACSETAVAATCSTSQGRPGGTSEAKEGEALDDAALLREFADEAYLISLHLNDTQPAPKAASNAAAAAPAQQPLKASAQTHHAASPAAPAPAPEPSRPSTQQAGGKAPAAGQADPPTPAPASTPAPAPAPRPTPTKLEAGAEAEAPVQLAAGVDCSSLAQAFGCSFGLGYGPKVSSNPKKAKKAERRQATALLQQLADSLHTEGWAVCDNYIPEDVVTGVRSEIKQMEGHYTPGEIWVGKEADSGAQVTVSDVRGDSVLWMDEQALAATAYIKEGKKKDCSFYTLQQVVKAVDQLVMHELPRLVPEVANLAAGGRSDAMLAIYPGRGSRFAKHIDNSANDGRRLTCLCYLNNGWEESMGGALRLSSPGRATVDVLPLGGRVAFFWSKTVAHEVRPTQKPRHSFTLWYYDAIEKAEALAAAKVGGSGSPAAQAQARALLRDILAQDVITPSDEGCSILAQRIRAMTTSALQIVAGVVGASNVQDFVYAASNMTPDGLAALRDAIGRMGLQSHAPTV